MYHIQTSPSRIINYHYSFDWKYVPELSGKHRNHLVGNYDGKYQDAVTRVPVVAARLRENSDTRQAILNINHEDYNSCLISVQFLIHGSYLYTIANFRSQHAKYGVPGDTEYLNHLVTLMMIETGAKPGPIMVNVGDYHGMESENKQLF